jgi:iron complex outermembrane recepter protein
MLVKSLIRASVGAGALIVGSISATAYAQAAAEDAPPAAAPEDEAIPEILVTARRVSESIQRTPISVSAVTGETIARENLFSIADMSPGPGVILDRDSTFPNSGAFAIRGISLEDKEPTFDPAVGVMVNGIYLARTYGAVIDLLDVERVEILRGPQGTLFGRNTMGGLLTINTRRPGADFAVRGQVSYSSFDSLDARLALDLPISGEKAGVTLAGQYKQWDGYFTNAAPGGPDAGGGKTASVRATLVLKPTDRLDMAVIADYTREDLQPFASNSISLPFQILAQPPFTNFVEDDANSPDRVFMNARGPNDGDYHGITAEVNYSFDRLKLTSVTGYRNVKTDVVTDIDRTGSTFLHPSEQTKQWQFSQELRAASDFDGAFNFVGGVYYFKTRVTLNRSDQIDLCMLQTLIGFPCVAPPTFFMPIQPGQIAVTNDGFYRQTTESKAIFGQSIIKLGERVRLTLGGRYTWEKKDFTIEPVDDDFVNQLFGIPDLTVSDSKKFKNFSPRAGLDFQITPTVLAYATFTRGYRSGGYNGRAGSITSFGPYGSEQVDSYELGIKSDLLDRRLRLNVAAYLNNYSDMQISVFRPTFFGQETVVENAGKARIGGLEIEAVVRPTRGLTISADAAWTDSKYLRFDADLDGDGIITDNTALNLRSTPKWRNRVTIDQQFDLSGGGELNINATWSHSSSFDTVIQNFAFAKRPAASEFDGNLTYRPDQNLAFSLFVKNAFNKRYVASGVPVGPFFSFRNWNSPRMVGLTISYTR